MIWPPNAYGIMDMFWNWVEHGQLVSKSFLQDDRQIMVWSAPKETVMAFLWQCSNWQTWSHHVSYMVIWWSYCCYFSSLKIHLILTMFQTWLDKGYHYHNKVKTALWNYDLTTKCLWYYGHVLELSWTWPIGFQIISTDQYHFIANSIRFVTMVCVWNGNVPIDKRGPTMVHQWS